MVKNMWLNYIKYSDQNDVKNKGFCIKICLNQSHNKIWISF